jgi:hypothetical protein
MAIGLQQLHLIVSMAGDETNDSPVFKKQILALPWI